MAAAGGVPVTGRMSVEDIPISAQDREKIKEKIKDEIESFIKSNCDKKSEGLSHYLCEFDNQQKKATNAYLLNSEFFKNAQILGEGSYGDVYDCGFWTIESKTGENKNIDIVVKTQKLADDETGPDPLYEAYINFVLINMIIMENPDIGLVPTFGLFYCGRKDGMFCVDKDGNKINENNSIFILQEKKNAEPLSVVRKFTKEMLIELFKILVKLEENGIYHCDINDGNILVDETNNNKIYLIDFGLASFMINGESIYQSDCDQSDCATDFLSICILLVEYNRDLYDKYDLYDKIKEFKNPHKPRKTIYESVLEDLEEYEP